MRLVIIFYIAAVALVLTLRKKYPDLPRPYKTRENPVVPLLFIIAPLGILINTLVKTYFSTIYKLSYRHLAHV